LLNPNFGFCSCVNAYLSLDKQRKPVGKETANQVTVKRFADVKKKASTYGFAEWPHKNIQDGGKYNDNPAH
jgi:hypothetical protein